MNNEEKILAILERMDTRLEKVETRLERVETGQAEMRATIGGMQTTIGEMKAEQAEMRATIGGMQTTIGEMKAEQAEMWATIGEMQTTMGEMQTTLTRVSVVQENTVMTQLQLLAEGHSTLLDTLAPKDRLDALEEDVDILKGVVRGHAKDIAELKKAQ